ncbi:MAG: hypothetical protein GWP09_00985 [Nitrospiraceae bacterium]|nr:hypothetical protein [Nitrospiraceae bacterium]
MKTSKLFSEILLILVVFGSFLILAQTVSAGCCVHNNNMGVTPASVEAECNNGFYVEADCNDPALQYYAQKGCCFVIDNINVIHPYFETNSWCDDMEGVFHPEINNANECRGISQDYSYDCTEDYGVGCIENSMYYCKSNGELVSNCSECGTDLCTAAGLFCDQESGFCVENEQQPVQPPNVMGEGVIYGYIKDEESSPIAYSRVIAYSDEHSYTVLSDENGFYKLINLPNDRYTLTAMKITAGMKYAPSSTFITLTDNGQEEVNFTLVSEGEISCNLDNVGFSAEPLRGKPFVKLIWSVPHECNDFNGYMIKRKNSNFNEMLPPYATSLVDKTTQWDTGYNYSIYIVHSDGSLSEPLTASIMTGNPLCEGVLPNYEFCYNGEEKDALDANLRMSCDEDNHLAFAPLSEGVSYNCSNYNAVCVELPNHKTTCKKPNICANSGNPLGLFYDEGTCLNTNDFCYYDYSNTILDACKDCDSLTCYDLDSKDACLGNSCGLNCSWKDTNTELNKGICYPEVSTQSNCDVCNGLFMNCTPSDCSLLGKCVMSSSGCEACSDHVRCEDYSTEQACEGSGWDSSNSCLPARSTDSCGLGVCRWINNKCVKDANGDSEADCINTENVDYENCINDTKPTDITCLNNNLVINGNNPVLSFKVSDSAPQYISLVNASYCVDSDGLCCPDTSANLSEDRRSFNINLFKNPVLSLANNGVYYLRYITTDQFGTHSNLNTVRFYLARSNLSIVNYLFRFSNASDIYNLSAFVQLSKRATCSYTIYPPILSEPTSDTSGRISSFMFVNFYNVTPCTYIMNLDCKSEDGKDELYRQLLVKGIGKGYINLTVSPVKYSNTKIPLLTWGHYNVRADFTPGVKINSIYLKIRNGEDGVLLKPLNELNCGNDYCRYTFTLDKTDNNDKKIADLRGILGEFVVNATLNGGPVDNKDINGINFAVYMTAPEVTIIIH